MSELQDFQQKRSAIYEAMMETLKLLPSPMLDENANQFINGYLAVIEGALQGDLGPRDEYLSLVLPPLKQSQMPLSYIIGVLVGINTSLMTVVDHAHAAWYAKFLSAYAEKLCEIWANA